MNEVNDSVNILFSESSVNVYEYLNTLSQEFERDSRRYNKAFTEESEVGTV